MFDVFGTVVDWRTSIIQECEDFGKHRNLDINWSKFVDEWRAGYRPAIDAIRLEGARWRVLDDVHREILLELLNRYSILLSDSDIEYLNKSWHRLHPWKDSVNGLIELNKMFITATLSNGNMSLLTNMAKFARLPWTCILSAEMFKHYKPDPETYTEAASVLGLNIDEVMMVASHKMDILAAKECGLVTAYINRPYEFGDYFIEFDQIEESIDYWAPDIESLAEQLRIKK